MNWVKMTTQPARTRPNINEGMKRFAKYLFEFDGKSLRVVAKETGVNFKTIDAWKTKYGWKDKGEYGMELVQYTRNMYLEGVAKAGLPPEEAFKAQVDGIKKPMRHEVVGSDSDGKPIVKKVPDYAVRNKYLKDHWTMAGVMGSFGRGGPDLEGGNTINIQINLPGTKDEE